MIEKIILNQIFKKIAKATKENIELKIDFKFKSVEININGEKKIEKIDDTNLSIIKKVIKKHISDKEFSIDYIFCTINQQGKDITGTVLFELDNKKLSKEIKLKL